jgi:hypothetical protein
MFIALETASKIAVTAQEATGQQQSPIRLDRETPYQCLLCGEPLEYIGGDAKPLESFRHHGESCFNAGNVSQSHQLAQEVVAKTLYNWLPTVEQRPEIDLERRVGTERDFIVTDVLVDEPIRLAVEIVHSAPVHLRRRLQRLFADGYGGLFVFLNNGRVSADRVEHHLHKLADLQVGRFNPQTLALTFGSIITPTDVPFDSQAWSRLPRYVV